MEKATDQNKCDDDRDTPMIGPRSSEGKMVIKFKIPKEDAKRVCVECKKEFSSGKALGGHMSVHVHAHVNKNPNLLKPSKLKIKSGGFEDVKKQPYYMESVNDEGKPTCSQCGKSFPSMKSLFGHMRCHPERVWRGVLPPRHADRVAAKTIISCSDNNSLVCGNNSLIDNDEVVDLVKCLPGWSVTQRRGRKALKQPANNDNVLMEAVEDLMCLAKGGVTSPQKSCGNKIKRRKKMKLMMELEQQTVSELKYKCNTCNKCFTTHQALGGHMSGHNKSKCMLSDHISQIEAQADPSSHITSTGEGASQTESGRKVFEFDLNEIPVIMMEEEDANVNEYGYGYACSSYNSNIG